MGLVIILGLALLMPWLAGSQLPGCSTRKAAAAAAALLAAQVLVQAWSLLDYARQIPLVADALKPSADLAARIKTLTLLSRHLSWGPGPQQEAAQGLASGSDASGLSALSWLIICPDASSLLRSLLAWLGVGEVGAGAVQGPSLDSWVQQVLGLKLLLLLTLALKAEAHR